MDYDCPGLGGYGDGLAPGSTPYSSPYDLPFVERPSDQDAGAFDGLLTLAETLSPSSRLNVLWMHGMCTHRPDWIDERLKKLAAALGSTPQTVNGAPGPQRPTSGSIARDVFDLLSRLLSYRLVPSHLAGRLREFRIVNVIVSNDTTYCNYVERPDKARCGYARNPMC